MSIAPILYLAISYFLASVFLVAAAHKLLRTKQFTKSLAGYDVIPEGWLRRTGSALAVLEAAIGIALLFGIAASIAAMVGSLLFLCYGGLMAFSLASGRGSMGCGCEWGEVPQPIRKWMIVRNVIFALLAAFLALATVSVSPTKFDLGNAAAAALALFLIHSSLAEILAVSHRIKLLRLGA